MDYMYLSAGPTKAPEDIQIERITSKKLILSWKPIPCSDQNGVILRYIVKYLYQEVSEGIRVHIARTHGRQLGIVLRNLRSNTKYNVSVAGVNIADMGVFSLPIVAITHGGKHYMDLDMSCSHGVTTPSLLFTNQLVRAVFHSNHSSPIVAA